MNSNHFNPKLSYARKLRRLKENISDLEDALQTLESLPFKTVQNLWRTIAEKDLPKKSEKTKSISKGSYKQCLKKTLQGFLVRIGGCRASSFKWGKRLSKKRETSTTRLFLWKSSWWGSWRKSGSYARDSKNEQWLLPYEYLLITNSNSLKIEISRKLIALPKAQTDRQATRMSPAPVLCTPPTSQSLLASFTPGSFRISLYSKLEAFPRPLGLFECRYVPIFFGLPLASILLALFACDLLFPWFPCKPWALGDSFHAGQLAD